ncbi:PGX, glycoside hydrolase family 28 protein [Amylocarpus encephaloides]|uniref:galacturonan 1,4-alpha-galacturonidase n=1 Tax=Amylocarpus encephaloides TaxID=45428 RepID=A0A9P7YM81_9HELO|nr:PGX, glycoside hydrolase family 28 protein [Amylocarpus encephaloides]
MRFFAPILAVASVSLSIAHPTVGNVELFEKSPGRQIPGHSSSRPSVKCRPHKPGKPQPPSPPRTKTCYIKCHNDTVTDDSAYVLEALHSCNNGGRAVFKQGVNYMIGKALDLTFLKHIDIDIQSKILFSNDTNYWQANSFHFIFQNVTSFFKLGGNDVNIYGGGTVDGNGQAWYDLYAKNIYALRPVLFGIDGLRNSVISNLVLRYSPQYYHFIANSTSVVFDNIDIAGGSKSANPAKNTDGWDTYRSDGIVIQNSHIVNGDDCVSFKPNSTNVVVQNMYCEGSHGISVGSLGQYAGEFDIVENIYVYNISMVDASDGARIKVWPNTASALSGDLQGGGGSGRVRNITYDTMFIDNVDYAIEVYQCYGQKNLTLCQEFPSKLTITDVVFKNFKGVTSSKFTPNVAAIACSSATACKNTSITGSDLESPNGTSDSYCLNVDEKALDLKCGGPYLGFN